MMLVAIYDARAQPAFRLSSANLTTVQHLPRYQNNINDPEGDGYVCTIGYGVNQWNRKRSGVDQPCISLNILFVIILGQLTE